jgi:ABC-type sulfate transport system permease component
MARNVEQVRHEIESEREQLADAVGSMRGELSRAVKLGARIPAAAAGFATAVFALRRLARRRR